MAATTETAAKERPIIMGPESVRAILDGRKTQTRREVKPQPPKWVDRYERSASPLHWLPSGVYLNDQSGALTGGLSVQARGNGNPVRCPFGAVGDRLWVREVWRETGSAMMTSGKISPCLRREEVVYAADGEWDGPWRSPIFMPRRASRLTLEVTAVRVDRLQDISRDDAIAEGIDGEPSAAADHSKVWRDYGLKKYDPFEWYANPVTSYRSLWESINGRGSWERNPYVWVIEFRRVTEGK